MTPPFFFLLLGAAIFAIETVAIQWNIRTFGGASASTGAALLAFFAGSGLGYFYYSRAIFRLSTKFIVTVALSLTWLPLVYKLLDSSFIIHDSSSFILKVAISIIATFPVYFTFSAFFPAMSKLLDGRKTTTLYAWNTIGTVTGVVLASFILPPVIGYKLIYVSASLLLLLSTIYISTAGGTKSLKVLSAKAPLPSPNILIACFLNGVAGILYETVLIRQMAIATDNTAYSFGSVAFFYILFAALASILIAKLPPFVTAAKSFFALASAIAGLGILYSVSIFITMTDGLATVIISNSTGPVKSLLFTIRILWPSLLPLTLIFPLIIRSAPSGSGGYILAANMIGGATGALLGGFILIPNAGIWGITLTAALLYPLISFVYNCKTIWNISAILTIAILLYAKPWNYPKITPNALSAGMKGVAKLIDVKEGRYGIVSVVGFDDNKTLWLNSSYVLGGNRSVVDDRRLGFLPSLLAKNSDNAAVIGVATGISLSGLSTRKWKKIDAVELVPEVADMARLYFSKDNNNILNKQNVQTIIDDGRHYLKNSKNKYDLIVSDLFIPWQEGSAALYSREHFRGAKNALTSDGIFMLWLPMYEITREEFHLILRTIGSEFPVVTIWQNGYSSRGAVVGLCAALNSLRIETLEENIARIKDTTSSDQLNRHSAALFSRCIGKLNLSSITEGAVNTLDKPILGFWAAKGDRKLLIGKNYIEEIISIHKNSINGMDEVFIGWTAEHDSWRKAGISMTLSVHELLNGNRDNAYAHFNEFKARMPALLHKP